MDAHSRSIIEKYGMSHPTSDRCRKWDQHDLCQKIYVDEGYDCDCTCHRKRETQPCTCHKWYRPQDTPTTPAVPIEE